MARSRGYSLRSLRSSGVARDWGTGPGQTAPTSLSASATGVLGSAITPVAQELTVLRTRGIFDIHLLSAAAAGDGFFGAVAIGKATLTAFTAGTGSLPMPINEAEWDGWLWHSFFSVHTGLAGLNGAPSESQRIEIDSKGMRKFDTAEVLYAAIQVVEVGTAVAAAYLDTRQLF